MMLQYDAATAMRISVLNMKLPPLSQLVMSAMTLERAYFFMADPIIRRAMPMIAAMEGDKGPAGDSLHDPKFVSQSLVAIAVAVSIENGLGVKLLTACKDFENLEVNTFIPDPIRALSILGITTGTSDEEKTQYITENMGALQKKLVAFINDVAEILVQQSEVAAEAQGSFVPWDEAEGACELDLLPQDSPKIPFIQASQVSIVDQRKKTIPTTTIQASPSGLSSQAVEQLKGDVALWKGRHESVSSELATVKQRLQNRIKAAEDDESAAAHIAERNRALLARVRYLDHHLAEARKVNRIAMADEMPTTWDALELFADERLAGKVYLTKRAIRSARSSIFIDKPFVYEVLLMLANDYVEMRRGDSDARTRFEEACKRLRVSVEPTGEAVTTHMTKDAYRVLHNGASLPLDLHVVGSSSRDLRQGFRLYFHYYDKHPGDEYVVVGHMPGHLENRMS